MKKVLFLFISLLMVFSLAACGGSDADSSSDAADTTTDAATETEDANVNEDRPFVFASAEFNGDFYSGWSNSTYDANVRALVFGFGLMTSNPKGEVIDSPLVESKTVSDDLTVWTFKLKDGLVFHNGEALTASDVKFAYDFYLDTEALEAVGGSTSLHNYISEITVDEAANTVEFTLSKVIYTTDVSVFTTYILPEETFTAAAADAGQTVQEYVKANISSPIGYGPYKFVEYAEAEYVRLAANPDFVGDYAGNQPSIKEIIVKVTPTETELDQLLQGEVDMLAGTVEAEKIEPVKNDDAFTYNNYFRHGGGTMVMHTDYEAFALTEVRQAFAYIFNRPKVIELFLGEYGIASQGPYSKNMWMMYDDDEADLIGTSAVSKFEASLTDYDIVDADGKFDEAANIAKAQDLLDAAVAKTDGAYADLTGDRDGGYMWKGEALTINVAFTAFWSDTYHLIFNDEYVSKLGFDVKLHGLDWPVMYGHWIGDTEEERQYHAFVGGVGYSLKENPNASYRTELIYDWGTGSENGPRFSGGSSYTPEEWDQLLLDIENAHPVTGADEYRENFRKYVTVMNEELPIIPVYSNNYHDLYTADLENFYTNALWDWTSAIVEANWK